MNLLIIEDEHSLADALAELLRQAGYSADTAYDGLSGLDEARTGIYDAVILDLMLPKLNGLEVLRRLRAEKVSTPVLLLTAKSEVADRIRGLDTGADDYLTKPFATGELLARLRAVTRRRGEFVGDVLQLGDLRLNKNTHEMECPGGTVKLGMKEYQIMELLLQNSRQIIPKERLFERIWGFESEAEYNAIEVYMSFLRRKLAAIGAGVSIRAGRGVGYGLGTTGDTTP
jgi:DNA-binding response OmpR family regulator